MPYCWASKLLCTKFAMIRPVVYMQLVVSSAALCHGYIYSQCQQRGRDERNIEVARNEMQEANNRFVALLHLSESVVDRTAPVDERLVQQAQRDMGQYVDKLTRLAPQIHVCLNSPRRLRRKPCWATNPQYGKCSSSPPARLLCGVS